MQISFEGKKAVVTGGTTGIGHAVAAALVEAGAEVLITGQNATRVEEAVARLRNRAHGIVADSASVTDAAMLGKEAGSRFGRLDLLVANAGVTWPGKIDEVTEKDFDGQVAINFKGPFFAVQKCLPLMGQGGAIVMTTSCLDELGLAGMAVYSATKAALRSLVRTLAVELAPRGIRVNGVAPGPIDTPIYDKLAPTREQADAARAEEAQLVVMKRMGQPEEVAKVVLFAASDAASYVTGANLRVDGGWTDI